MEQYSRADAPSQTAYPIATAGYPFIFAAAFATAVFALLGLVILALVGIVATGFICFFFRDPDRVTPEIDGAIASPADGKVIGARLPDGVCPIGTIREVELTNGAIACLGPAI
jgi:phosphatidylserine decarboxylase